MNGSEKQIKWAEDIKERFAQETLGNKEIREENLDYMRENNPNNYAAYMKIMGVEDAAWWIDNRRHLQSEVNNLKHIRRMIESGRIVF